MKDYLKYKAIETSPMQEIICTKCERTFPATEEFFHHQKSSRTGWYLWCKKCVKDHQHEPDVQARARAKRLIRHPHKSYDMIGQKYGRLLVISHSYTDDHGRSYWNCQCDCGQMKVTSRRNLLSRGTQSCGCLWREARQRTGAHNKKAVGESAFNQLYYNYKKSARQRKYIFELDMEQFRDLTSSPCSYCGLPPSIPAPRAKGTNGDYLYNGIDRVDNNHGYIKGNVRSCCKQCNFAKGILTEDEFFAWIQRLTAFTATRQARFEYGEKGRSEAKS